MCVCVCVCAQSILGVDSLQPHGLKPARLLCPWDSPGKNTGVVSHFLLQGIFPTQGSNPGLPHCRRILYHVSYQGSPIISFNPHLYSLPFLPSLTYRKLLSFIHVIKGRTYFPYTYRSLQLVIIFPYISHSINRILCFPLGKGFPRGSVNKESASKQETWVPSLVGKIPWRRKWQPTPVFFPGKSHGWRNLIGYSSWAHKESDTVE